ncbi:MAG: GtrA family protein [Clostridiales bacterium]|nr:GtrA family protein [Clostridiales bacterium]
MKRLIEQIMKFGIIGIIATVVDWGIFALLVELYGATSLFTGVISLKNWKVVATVISFSVSVVVNYLASMKYVFERRDDMSRTKEFVIFLGLSIIGLGINVLIIVGLEGIVQWFATWPAIIYRFAYMVPKVVATSVVLVWNFVTRKIFLEKKQEIRDI